MSPEFQEMLMDYEIKAKPTTIKNPQANAMVEHIHLTMDSRPTSVWMGHDTSYPDGSKLRKIFAKFGETCKFQII